MKFASPTSAIVRAINAEFHDATCHQAWHAAVASGYREEPAVNKARESVREYENLIPCWLHGRLHRELRPDSWCILNARFSASDMAKVSAMFTLSRAVPSQAPMTIKRGAVYSWTFPRKRGLEQGWMLPERYHSIESWDTDGHPARTLYRWRRQIHDWLNDQLSVAIAEATEIIQAEGVLEEVA